MTVYALDGEEETVYAWWVRGFDFVDLALESMKSVRRADPDAHCVVVCDDPMHPGEIDEWDRAIVLPEGRPAMAANLDAQINVLNAYPFGTRILFLDADTLVKKPFPFGDEDLYVTWRDHVGVQDGRQVEGIAALMPINYGVLGVVNSPAVVEAFYWLRARILRMAPKHQDWYGNQLAIADLVAARPEGDVAERRIMWSLADEGTPIRVRWLPCEQFNYSPESEGEDVSSKYILHFKGNRKSLIEHYAAA